MAKKQYENFTIFGARIYGMRNLWQPSTEYMGKPTQRPSYLAGFIVPKTRGHWSEEPVFAGVWGAMQKIYSGAMNGMPYNMVDWPIRDGDLPEPGKSQADWARGHWMFGGNSGDPIKVEIVQNNVPVPLVNRAVVKPGDFVTVAGATAQKSNDPRGIKFYINTVLFMAPGEEIAVGHSVSGAELMAAAQAQGLQVAGFGGAAGAFPNSGFAAAPGQNAAPAFVQQGGAFAQNGGGQGFNPGGAPNFSQQGSAPQPQSFVPPNGPGGFAPTHANSATAFPSNNPGAPNGFGSR